MASKLNHHILKVATNASQRGIGYVSILFNPLKGRTVKCCKNVGQILQSRTDLKSRLTQFIDELEGAVRQCRHDRVQTQTEAATLQGPQAAVEQGPRREE
ncbi:hypothetical protein Vafri_22163, partial [Volvox africanus]